MKRLLCAVMLIAGWLAPLAAEPPDAALLMRLRDARTVRLTVDQTYLYTTRENSEKKIIAGFSLPYATVARGLLEGAGVVVVEPAKGESGDHEASLTIAAHGWAVARFYDDQVAGYLYTGAEIVGDIALSVTESVPGVAAWHTAFRSVQGPPLKVRINRGFDRPEGAPFAEAFTGPTSFTARMVEVIGLLYGATPLIAALNGGSAAIRPHAAKFLGTVGGPGAAEALLAVITDKDSRLRKEAAWSLGRLGDRRAIDALTLALNDGDMDVRWFAAWALEKIAQGPIRN